MAEAELARVEADPAARLDGLQLLALAKGLGLRRAQEFGGLLQRRGMVRRFRVFGAGLPKTGTLSLCGIFGQYRTAHEFWQWETQQQVVAWRHGRLAAEGLVEFLRERDGAASVELDSAHFNCHYVGLLAGMFPDARFIGLVRDPFSWVASQANYFTAPDHEAIQAQEFPNGFPFDLPRGANQAKAALLQHFELYAEGVIAFWAESVRSLAAALPAGRSLVVCTHELSSRLDEVASFVGVPRQTLRADQTHLNRAQYHANVLATCDRGRLRGWFSAHCTDLIEAFFPGFTLDRFLDQRSPAGSDAGGRGR